MFKVGQRVVCVDDNFPRLKRAGARTPVARLMYTIRGFNSGGGIRLKEFNNNLKNFYGEEVGFLPFHFRPLDEDFAEETLARITKEVMEEELIEIGCTK